MQVEFDTSELARLAKNRNCNIERVLTDYINEYLTLNPCFMYDLQFNMEETEQIFRCIGCGYWLDSSEASPHDGNYCRDCDEK